MARPDAIGDPAIPVVVALDRCLVRADIGFERMLLRVAGGAKGAQINPGTLPLNETLAGWLRNEAAKGRRIILCDRFPSPIMNGIAARLGGRIETIDAPALGESRLSAIRSLIGQADFVFAGHHAADMPVWCAAIGQIAVDAPRNSHSAPLRFDTRATRAADVLRGLRPLHWVKNLLVFLPAMGAHQWGHPEPMLASLAIFIAFCLCSSAVYLTNDLLDLEDDRSHAEKRSRPLASGAMAPSLALRMIAVLMLAALLIAASVDAAMTLTVYFLASLLYSLRLKLVPVLDLLWLAGLYTIRILAGSSATGIPTSPWLLALSGFIFLSLAATKRGAELGWVTKGALLPRSRRNYQPSHRGKLTILGVITAFMTNAVLFVYVREADVSGLYARPLLLELAGIVLLLWLLRLWLLVQRGALGTDPVVFAIKDRASWLAAIAIFALCLAAIGS